MISVIGEKAIALFTRQGRLPLLCVQTTLWFGTTLSKRFGVAIKASCQEHYQDSRQQHQGMCKEVLCSEEDTLLNSALL
ncbi:hypothetical protein [Nostoc sp. UHCC 0251]|uniref:hypothetical protein n=1 Tax=Nostoc sp. UHCC 0251 TaxID=3110240 RepID=UPI002B21211A|nr:hypothetical protein [Nostoc sp. UHCC 0251]MEA5628104.1 hypothetical protein [Nostoc sp. UHCC 0251]